MDWLGKALIWAQPKDEYQYEGAEGKRGARDVLLEYQCNPSVLNNGDTYHPSTLYLRVSRPYVDILHQNRELS